METMKKTIRRIRLPARSPFAEVYKYQSVNGDKEGKPQVIHGYMPVLHLQMCRSINPLMENRVWEELISHRCASLSPNYGRKSHGYGEISILLWGEQPANT